MNFLPLPSISVLSYICKTYGRFKVALQTSYPDYISDSYEFIPATFSSSKRSPLHEDENGHSLQLQPQFHETPLRLSFSRCLITNATIQIRITKTSIVARFCCRNFSIVITPQAHVPSSMCNIFMPPLVHMSFYRHDQYLRLLIRPKQQIQH